MSNVTGHPSSSYALSRRVKYHGTMTSLAAIAEEKGFYSVELVMRGIRALIHAGPCLRDSPQRCMK